MTMPETTTQSASPAVAESPEQGAGIVHLGSIRAQAQWNPPDADYLMVHFDNSRLTPDQILALRHIRSSSAQLTVKLPQERRSFRGVVIGFENAPQGITLHISK